MGIKLQVSIIIEKNDKFLLVKEGDPAVYGYTNLPGGHTEAGETPQEAAVREAKEETGLDISLQKLLGIYCFIRKDQTFLRIVYLATVEDGSLSAGEDILELLWMSVAEVKAQDKLVNRKVLNAILTDLEKGESLDLDVLKTIKLPTSYRGPKADRMNLE